MSKIKAITIPKWGIEMKKGTIGNWLVNVGETINNGDEIVEIETDKITNCFEATSDGKLIKVIANEGEELPVGHLIGLMSDEDVDEVEIENFISKFVPPTFD
ncbi:MAG: biotin/lipoyl-containing protein [Candidatus Micropelagos sp.]|uniref:Lipoyl-binding domain-containing protein n=1 Tax=PS1 clade bacterium TaxID=2175152 RepID=A0A368EJK4_9PROT|nr:MAG: hypothetical protein DBW64_02870 [PS1 clade bacterium]